MSGTNSQVRDGVVSEQKPSVEMKAKPEARSPTSSLSCGVDADSVLRQLGQAGRFHLRVYVLVALAAVQVGLLHTTYIFLAADVPYR